MTPIRPENRSRYPEHWAEIRQAILKRAENRCECYGECGCIDLKVIRSRRCLEIDRTEAKSFRGIVILTIAHLDHKPENCTPENLRAMCQACHLRYDKEHHSESRRKNRDAETGQGSLEGIS
jgi:hypothetical protein